MKQRLNEIREKAIAIREKLFYANPDEQKKIVKLDKIIRGAVLVKWMHLFACIFFIIFAAVFVYLMSPDVKAMMGILGIAACGYAISWVGIVIQIKLYDRTIGKVAGTTGTPLTF